MKKLLFVIFIVVSATAAKTNFVLAEEENILESASLQLSNLNIDLAGPNNAYIMATFVLKNISETNVKTKMYMQKISLTEGHFSEFCYGTSCEIFPNEWNPDETSRTSSENSLAPGATTDPNSTSYIKMRPNGIEGKDTIYYKIYNVDDTTDFVQFTATWDFDDGSIKILNSSDMKIYPNPVANYLYVTTNEYENIEAIEIYNVAGNLVQSEQVSNLITSNADNNLIINTAALQAGTYIGYLLQNGVKVSAFKFVK